MKSCRKNANALKRLSAAITLSSAGNGTGATVLGSYDCSKDEYWNGANSTKSIDLIDLEYNDSIGKKEPVQSNPRKNPSIELKRKSISIMPFSSGSSSSSNEEVNNVGLGNQSVVVHGNTRAFCGREEKTIVGTRMMSPNCDGHTKTNAQLPSAEVPRRGKCSSGNVAAGEDPGYKGHTGIHVNATSTPILKRYEKRSSSSMTPSPCVLRRLREAILTANKNNFKDPKADENDSEDEDETISTLIDSNGGSPFSTITRNSGRARNLSGPSASSSMSTLTPFSGNCRPKTATAAVDQYVAYSSLHRPSTPKHPHNNGGIGMAHLKSCLSTNHSRGYCSASASPLLNGQNGGYRRLAGLANSNSIQGIENYAYVNGTSSPVSTGNGNDLSSSNVSYFDRTLETLKHEIGAAKMEARQLQTDMGSLRQDVGNLAESIISVHKTLVDTQDKMGQLGAQVNNIERQINTIVKETNTIRNHAEKLVESAESSKVNYSQLEEEAKNLVGYLKDVLLHYSTLCNCCNFGDSQPQPQPQMENSLMRNGMDGAAIHKHDGSHRKMTICESNDAARKNYFNECLKDVSHANGNHEDIIEYPLGN